ncbi:efflux RND transporter periplasmic adaptor subunit [Paludisphaera mucosa]|uniref:Efflux RND transporter periplasmic adaptor subunit n=1 Tax=Paludisphaera mucosa TaxID=3030827 RepID=A0ABT6FEX6_9BACT|nr:efflux RND transporter periplasmic adaptor subunit [Paludisphaera mucosa]MDG3006135.1 efflux RND transporter periplasmic adaptor subunit [Paludisphaera mucosa]
MNGPRVRRSFARYSWPAWLLLALAAGCRREGLPPAAPAAKVVATSPVRKPIVEWDEYVGRIDPIESVEVRARVSGHLESTHFEEGQIVQKGDLLCILDQRPFRLAVEQAEADLARAVARSEEAEAQRVQADAEVESAESQRELSVLMLGRARRLVAKNALAQEELDIRETSFKQTSADRDVKKARVALAKAAVTTAAADMRAAQSQLATARLNLSYTEVRAPVTGRVSRRVVTDGNLISGGTDQATLLTTIVSLDPIHCYFDADEQSFLKYMRLVEAGKLTDLRHSKLPVFVGLADESKRFPHQGHLDFLDNRMDRKTATMRGRAILPNPDLSLTPGLFAKVRIPGSGRHDAVLIPDSAIATDQSEKFVYVVDEGNTIHRQKVDIGRRVQGLRIVREGLAGPEKILLRGLQRVKPGSLVDATFEETLVVDDGLPDDAQPLPEGRWLPSYAKSRAESGERPPSPPATALGSTEQRTSEGMMP